MSRGPVIAIDGPAASGKTTVARLLARRLGLLHLHSGALYRALTLLALRKKADLTDGGTLVTLLKQAHITLKHTPAGTRVLLQGEDVTDAINQPLVTAHVKHIAEAGEVRWALLPLQRALAAGGAVAEGRDMGTVVFPEAPCKFYLDGNLTIRAGRRYLELKGRGEQVTLKQVRQEIEARDRRDASRDLAPLKQAEDAWYVDASDLSVQEVVNELYRGCQEKLRGELAPMGSQCLRTSQGERSVGALDAGPWWYKLLRFWARLLFILFFRIRVFGRDKVPTRGGVVIASNHQSFLDPVIIHIGIERPIHFMARENLFVNKFFRRLISGLNAFPLKRATFDLQAVREAVRRLKAGKVVIVFPEGARTTDGKIGQPLGGAHMIARRGNVPIVPTVIQGAYEAWPRQQKLFRFTPIRVIFGEAFWPDETGEPSLRERWLALEQELQREGISEP